MIPRVQQCGLALAFAVTCLAPANGWAQGSNAGRLEEADLRFKAREHGEFEFNTGVLAGTLRRGGKSIGLLPVEHLPTGKVLTRSMGLFGHYRVFSGPRRFGNGAWNWESRAELRPDGSVEVHWPATEDRPFAMRALYRWAAPAILDVETSVEASSEQPDFEAFLASYLAGQFTNSRVYARAGASDKTPSFVPAEESAGDWQMFPRDRKALELIHDGRWKIAPSPVDWAIRPVLAAPVALRRDPETGTTVVVMAPPEDCFAISTPHQTEAHYSLYLSLFGRTLKTGETSRARARLAVISSPDDEQVLKLYREYLEDLKRGR